MAENIILDTPKNIAGWGIQFNFPKFPLEKNKLFETYSSALTYAGGPDSYIGNVISILNDEVIGEVTHPSGVYVVTGVGESAAIIQVGKDTDLTNYYTKGEVDGLIPEVPIKSITLNGHPLTPVDGIVELSVSADDIEVDLSNYYTKGEVDELIPGTSDLATKTEVETALATKQNVIDDLETIREGAGLGATALQADAINDMATKTWVGEQGYLTEHQSLADYAKTSEVDSKIVAALTSVYKYKGSVATYDALPTENNTVGDVYNVESTDDNYAWNGTNWDKLGGTVDLSSYYTKTEVDTLLGNKADKSTTLSGYGITDAKIEDGVITLGSNTITPITSHQDISGLATKTEVEEVETALGTKQDTITAENKLSPDLVSGLAAVATSGSYNDLSDKPVIPSLDGYATEEWVGENYVLKVENSRLMTNDEGTKLGGIEEGAEVNVIENIQVKTDDTTTSPLPVGDNKTVTIDLSGINGRIKTLEGLVVGGEGEGLSAILQDVEDLKTGKQDKLADGSAENPHLIWVSSTNDEGATIGAWTPGKIEIPTELPEYTADNAGQILTVNTDGSEVIWASAPVSASIEENKETVTVDGVETEKTVNYTITAGDNSVIVYSAAQVDSFFTWQTV